MNDEQVPAPRPAGDLAGLGEAVKVPPAGSEDEAFWLEAAMQYGFEQTDDNDRPTLAEENYRATGAQILALMAAAREQGRRDARPLYEAAPRPAGDLAGLSERARDDAFQRFVYEGGTNGSFLTAFNAGLGAGRRASLTPAAPRPAVTEEDALQAVREAMAKFWSDKGADDCARYIREGGWDHLDPIAGTITGGRTVLSLFRDADRGGEEGAR